MPRNAAIARTADVGAKPVPRTVAVSLHHPDSIAAWDALVARCGGAQAAFEALVLLPAALEAAGIDAEVWLRGRGLR